MSRFRTSRVHLTETGYCVTASTLEMPVKKRNLPGVLNRSMGALPVIRRSCTRLRQRRRRRWSPPRRRRRGRRD
eukprot:10471427-Prorocentrum_lima.AAC.1